jgi:hypothetical protein
MLSGNTAFFASRNLTVARIMANERLKIYLNAELQALSIKVSNLN